MKYNNTAEAIFRSRPNRFIAYADINGKTETVHVKNTGRCRELLIPGRRVILAKAENQARKTLYDLISVYKPTLGWVNIDSMAPNTLVREWLDKKPSPFSDIKIIKPEYTYGKSRVDFYLECGFRKILIEVKGCTLEESKIGYFPDAPTERGVKHLNELAKAVSAGFECYIAFVIAMPEVSEVRPNILTHPEFGKALSEAEKSGVHILWLPCLVSPDEIIIEKCIVGKSEF